ncbi:MAG: NADH-dependent [FeFe] hydrogenase, group A6 [Christensenellales bacterium]|jgi:NADP-reducing hydrogenase subunit HndD
MSDITLKIDGVSVTVPVGTTVLEAARAAGIRIPTLCYMKGLNEIGGCRMCLVETGARIPGAACVLPVESLPKNRETGEINVKTNTPLLRDIRKSNLELLLSTHDKKCLSCVRSTTCELQDLCVEYGVDDEDKYNGLMPEAKYDDSSLAIRRNNAKCIICRRCVAMCDKVQNVGVIGAIGRGMKTEIASAWGMTLAQTGCINCGQCIAACPTGALIERDDTQKVWDALADEKKFVVVQAAPAVRAALGEEFGMPIGTNVTGKLASSLRRLGFDKVFDTNFAADLTIMEEASELVARVKEGGVLPMITSCSPGWIKFCETYYPDFIPNLSSCKSPHEMEGAVIKSYFAEKSGIDPKDIVVVSVMPCTAKKYEAARPELGRGDIPDVDIVITTRELGRMIKVAGIDFANLPDDNFDEMLGEYSGAAVIFGVTGGVMEAALRTAYEVITGEKLAQLEFNAVRGFEGVREASYNLNGLELKVAVAHSTGAASKLLDSIRSGEKDYTFIEIMGCPGGCINGGGQPIVSPTVREKLDVKALRAQALYSEDAGKAVRKSHESPYILKLYEDYFGEPNSHKAHDHLHTTYVKRSKYN